MTERRADTASSSARRQSDVSDTKTTRTSPTGKTSRTGASPDKGSDKGGDKGSGSERFAAAIASARSKGRDAKPTASGPQPQRTPTSSRPRSRKARLRVTHVDPWSVMKVSFLLSIALGIVTIVSVAIVWTVLGAAGVWESINATVGDVVGDTGSSFRIEDYLGMSRVMGFTMIVAVVDVVLVTVIATLGAFLYNLAAALLGGLEVVLAEDER